MMVYRQPIVLDASDARRPILMFRIEFNYSRCASVQSQESSSAQAFSRADSWNNAGRLQPQTRPPLYLFCYPSPV